MGHPFCAKSESGKAHLLLTKPEQLKVGMFVDLNCSWFKHPFASKTFKITSEKELAVIRGLGLNSVLVDPVLSRPERPEQRTKDDSDGKQNGTGISSLAPVQTEPHPDSAQTPYPTIVRYQESLQQADAFYKQTLSQSRKALDDIRTGSEAGLMATKEMINGLTDLLLDDAASSAMGSLLSARDLDDLSMLHAMNVAVLSMLVGRSFDLSHEQTQTLGIAGLLHDIGEQQLPPHLHKQRGASLTGEDRKAFERHVEFGLSMLAQFPGLPVVVTEIIRQHHERIDGSGYPYQLKGRQLSLLSRIVMVVDEYESLINAPDMRDNLTPTEALSKLYRSAKTTFSEEAVVSLIQILSVYPPGTVVELNDNSIGLVISINLQARMRPLVILYDSHVDQENPKIADLSTCHDLSIVRSIARSELDKEMYDYLNITRWTGYFINSSMKALEERQD